MRNFEKYSETGLLKEMLRKISTYQDKVKIMEVCGTHTRAFSRSGIQDILPENITLISGPGCPVCVTTQAYIDTAIELAAKDKVIIATFADLLRVPGRMGSLGQKKAAGGEIRLVNSPLEAVKIAEENSDYELVFLAVGFETTAPLIALSIMEAEELNLENYSLLLSIKTMPPVIEELLLDKDLQIDAFICPGHVSTIIGSRPFHFIAEKYRVPAVIAGFERVDIILALAGILEMIKSGNIQLENLYQRVVNTHGNHRAKDVINQVFEPVDSRWRGMGVIKGSGLGLNDRYKRFDAAGKYELHNLLESKEEKIDLNCCCGDIIKGKKSPLDCKLFSSPCTPTNPKGPCMVSEEGSCNIFYEYRKRR